MPALRILHDLHLSLTVDCFAKLRSLLTGINLLTGRVQVRSSQRRVYCSTAARHSLIRGAPKP
jgi:hypothetical protein